MICAVILASVLAIPTPGWLPEAFSQSASLPVSTSSWWSNAEFENLENLISAALHQNGDVQAARSGLQQAEAIKEQALSPLFPSLRLDATLNVAPTASMGFSSGASLLRNSISGVADLPDQYYMGAAAIKANWAIDYAGRNYWGFKAAKRAELATRGEVDRAALGLALNVTEAYFDVILAKEQLLVLQEQYRASTDFLDVISLRFDRGEASGVDLLQQKGQVANAAARLPAARAQVENSRRRLGVWLGLSDLSQLDNLGSELPTRLRASGIGVPKDLVHNRPVLRSAALRFESAQAKSAHIIRRHLPSLSISGQYGYQYMYQSDWEKMDVWGAGVVFSMPIFSGLGDQAAVSQVQAETAAAKQTYEQLYRRVISEVEIALANVAAAQAQLDSVKTALAATRLAYEQVRGRYLSGIGDYVSTLTALRSYQQNQLTTLSAKRSQLSSQVRLRAVVGGPWARGLGTSRGEK